MGGALPMLVLSGERASGEAPQQVIARLVEFLGR
jgi:hypothetical protein